MSILFAGAQFVAEPYKYCEVEGTGSRCNLAEELTSPTLDTSCVRHRRSSPRRYGLSSAAAGRWGTRRADGKVVPGVVRLSACSVFMIKKET